MKRRLFVKLLAAATAVAATPAYPQDDSFVCFLGVVCAREPQGKLVRCYVSKPVQISGAQVDRLLDNSSDKSARSVWEAEGHTAIVNFDWRELPYELQRFRGARSKITVDYFRPIIVRRAESAPRIASIYFEGVHWDGYSYEQKPLEELYKDGTKSGRKSRDSCKGPDGCV